MSTPVCGYSRQSVVSQFEVVDEDMDLTSKIDPVKLEKEMIGQNSWRFGQKDD